MRLRDSPWVGPRLLLVPIGLMALSGYGHAVGAAGGAWPLLEHWTWDAFLFWLVVFVVSMLVFDLARHREWFDG